MCCFESSKVHTRTDNAFVRINGWTFPLNCLQVVTWIVILFCGFVFFGIVALAVEERLFPATYVSIGVFYAIHVICLFVATSINPADDNSIRSINESEKSRPVFNRSVHKHVIEQGYCHICEVTVGGLSKHCSVCNKCVSVFDHHCKWLNNCVGDKNYRIFLLTLISAIIASLGIIGLSVYVLINAIQGFNVEVWWKSPESLKIAFEVLIGILVVVLVACIILLSQLLGFHIMLMKRGMTTYEYIKRIATRKKELKQQAGRTAANGHSDAKTKVDKKSEVSFVSLNERAANERKNTTSAFLSKDDSKASVHHKENGVSDQSGSQAYLNQSYTSDASDYNEVNQHISTASLNNSNNNPSSTLHSPSEEHHLPHAVPDNLHDESKAREQKKRKRKRRKSQVETVHVGTARPLPLPLHPVLESPSAISGRNSHLPPVRDSVEWTSSMEDLTVGAMKGRKLPPLSNWSSTTSLTSSAVSEAQRES